MIGEPWAEAGGAWPHEANFGRSVTDPDRKCEFTGGTGSKSHEVQGDISGCSVAARNGCFYNGGEPGPKFSIGDASTGDEITIVEGSEDCGNTS